MEKIYKCDCFKCSNLCTKKYWSLAFGIIESSCQNKDVHSFKECDKDIETIYCKNYKEKEDCYENRRMEQKYFLIK